MQQYFQKFVYILNFMKNIRKLMLACSYSHICFRAYVFKINSSKMFDAVRAKKRGIS